MSPRRARPPALYTKAPFLQQVLDGMPESVKIIDDRYRLVYANAASRKTLGAGLNELRGQPCHQAFYGFKDRCFFCNMDKVFSQGRSHTTYCTFTLDGVNRDFEVTIFPLEGEDGKASFAVEMVRDVTPLSKGQALPQNAGKLSSRDRAFAHVFQTMAEWANDGKPVLLQGEKGTGKKSFAQALHQRSSRSHGPFRVFHCVDNPKGDCSEGLFGPDSAWEKARGGTLYLDGICALGEASQRKLGERLADASPDDPRVVAGTRQDIQALVHQEVLRVDLFNRFASRTLRLPALRDRKQDLPFLAQHFIETYRVLTGSPAEKMGQEAFCQLMTYDWPGNIRELETLVERACLLAQGPVIDRLDLPSCAPKVEKLDDLMSITEKAYLVETLTKSRGDLAEVVKLSGLTPKTLQRKLKKHGLKAEDFRNLPQD
ncbi:MAG TPA: sigma 54-interacting transcriptional regulator [bacterium]|nr:sigma 54-interacting transcriptional regulator [bacterium]